MIFHEVFAGNSAVTTSTVNDFSSRHEKVGFNVGSAGLDATGVLVGLDVGTFVAGAGGARGGSTAHSSL